LPPATRILVAEDHMINQMLIEKVLAKADCSVTLLDNGRAAVDAVSDGDFEALIMDVQMPELDGPAAAREIRRLPARCPASRSSRLPSMPWPEIARMAWRRA
jgi:CheY-like chemotaxis protein